MDSLPQQCRDAARALKDGGEFETGQAILLEAAAEIERLRVRDGEQTRMIQTFNPLYR